MDLWRHSRAMHLYNRNGMPLPLIAEWLGHSKMDTTRQFYANANEIVIIPTFYFEIIEYAALNKHFQDK